MWNARGATCLVVQLRLITSREKSSELRGQKRSLPESTEATAASQENTQQAEEEPEDGLRMWGYMPGHVHYNLTCAGAEVRYDPLTFRFHTDLKKSLCPKEAEDADKSNEVDKVLPAIPPRSITGTIKQILQCQKS